MPQYVYYLEEIDVIVNTSKERRLLYENFSYHSMYCGDCPHLHCKRKAGKCSKGAIGVENELTPDEIRDADVILISADIRVNKERFKGKAVVEIPISTVMKSPKGVISKIHEKLGK